MMKDGQAGEKAQRGAASRQGKTEENMEEKVFYLCDRRACEKCRPECSHTTDPSHAKNFVTTEKGGLWEVYPGLFDRTDLTIRQKLDVMANAEGEGAKA